MPGSISAPKIAVPSPTGRRTFHLVLTWGRTSTEGRSPLRRWRTPRHSYAFSFCFYHCWGFISQDMATLQLASRQCPSSLIIGIFVADPMNLMLTTILIGIPLYQLMVRNCRLYAPNMLKRMGLGLLCCLVKVIVELVIHATMTNGKACKNFYENFIRNCFFILTQFDNNGTCSALSEIQDFCPQNNLPFLLMIIPNILQGFAFILVFMTTFEFICAQAPLRLKGLLIGIWYASLAVYYLPVRVSELMLSHGRYSTR